MEKAEQTKKERDDNAAKVREEGLYTKDPEQVGN